LSNYSQRAVELFKQGYNCSQSVVAAFCEELDVDIETALKISASFGAGMGRLREVCGAVSGMFIVAGMKYGYTDPKDFEAKAEHYKMIQHLANQFKEENNSIICRELLGIEAGPNSPIPELRTKEYYKKRPCAELVGCAAEILEQVLKNKLNMEECKMKIIVPVESKSLDTPVCQSFGRTPLFVLVDTEKEKEEFLDNEAAASQGGAGIKASQMIADCGATAVITYRLGQNAADVLIAANIKIYKAQDGTVKENVEKFKEGKLDLLNEIHAGFHNHGGEQK